MKIQQTITAMSFAMSCLVFAGCVDSAGDKAAENVRESTQQQADEIRDNAQNKAENVRESNGETVFGNAQSDVVEERADNIEANAEELADAVEAVGEQRADNLEDDGE